MEPARTGKSTGQQPALPPAEHPVPPALPPSPPAPPHSSPHWVARIVAMVVVLALLAGAGFGVYYLIQSRASASQSAGSAAAAAKNRATPVIATVAVVGDLPIYREGPGTAQAKYTVTLHTRVDGQLINVPFQEGQKVQKGDLLAQIDPAPFKAMLEEAQGQLAKDNAMKDNAVADLMRYQKAATAVPAQQLATQQALVDQLKAAIQSDQGAVDNAQTQLDYTTISSPISGVIGLRNVDPGNIVHATDTNGLATITQLQPITVVFTLGQGDLPDVLKAMQASPGNVPVLAYNSMKTKLLSTGHILALDNQIDPSSGTFRVKAEFANADEALYPNQFVNARVLVDTMKGVVEVPSEAVQQSPSSTYVFVIDKDMKAQQRDVTPGPSEGNKTAILKGLAAGEMVATEGLDRLEEGTLVKIQPAATQSGKGKGPATQQSGHATSGPAASSEAGSASAPAGGAAGTQVGGEDRQQNEGTSGGGRAP